MNLIHGDCVEQMAAMAENSVDAVVCDPPYGLEFMGKEWDGMGHGNSQQAWHHRWAVEALRVLRPGGHLLAFGGTRTSHRLVCALEDAGFEIRDTICWLYGTGFPKSHNVGKQEGCEAWQGWGTALKPAHEPICVARKPLGERTVAANVLKHGTGGVNVDGCRIEGVLEGDPSRFARTDGGTFAAFGEHPPVCRRAGRWPANVCLDEAAAAMLDEQTGDRPGFAGGGTVGAGFRRAYVGGERGDTNLPAQTFSDRGGASRFFYCAKASRKEREAGLEGRNTHPTVKPVALMRWLVRLVTPPGGTVLDPFLGSGTTGIAAKMEGFEFVGIEQDADYVEMARRRSEHAEVEMPLFAAVGAE